MTEKMFRVYDVKTNKTCFVGNISECLYVLKIAFQSDTKQQFMVEEVEENNESR